MAIVKNDFSKTTIKAHRVDGLNALSVLDCVMYKGGKYLKWDTTDLSNSNRFVGIVYAADRDFYYIATEGVFKALGLADGVYYCDSVGGLVLAPPSGAFDHQVGEQKDGRFFISRIASVTSGAVIPNPKQVIWVETPADIVNKTLDPTKIYYIDTPNLVLTASQQIRVPQNGLVLYGFAPKISKITSTDPNHTLFINDGATAGSLRFNGLTFSVSGSGSKVFDLDNVQEANNENNNVDFTDINFVDCENIGTLANYRQFFWSVGSAIFCNEGLELAGTWSGGARIDDNRSIMSQGVLLKAGAGLTMGGRVLVNTFFTNVSTSVISDFSPANIVNDGDFQMISGDTTVNGLVADFFPNMPISSTKAFFDYDGIRKSVVGGEIIITTEAATPLPALGGESLVQGVFTINREVWFGIGANGKSLEMKADKLKSQIVIASGSVDLQKFKEYQIELRAWDDSAAAYVVLGQTIIESNKTGVLESFVITGSWDAQINDRYELWVTTGLLSVLPATFKEGTRIKAFAL